MIISGAKHKAKDYIEGLEMLASMRLCANVPSQHAIQTSLGGYQSINDLVAPGGRIYEQRNIAYEALNSIPGISCTKPMGALYCFPKVDIKKFNIKNVCNFFCDCYLFYMFRTINCNNHLITISFYTQTTSELRMTTVMEECLLLPLHTICADY